jgi:hypothetical protein
MRTKEILGDSPAKLRGSNVTKAELTTPHLCRELSERKSSQGYGL